VRECLLDPLESASLGIDELRPCGGFLERKSRPPSGENRLLVDWDGLGVAIEICKRLAAQVQRFREDFGHVQTAGTSQQSLRFGHGALDAPRELDTAHRSDLSLKLADVGGDFGGQLGRASGKLGSARFEVGQALDGGHGTGHQLGVGLLELADERGKLGVGAVQARHPHVHQRRALLPPLVGRFADPDVVQRPGRGVVVERGLDLAPGVVGKRGFGGRKRLGNGLLASGSPSLVDALGRPRARCVVRAHPLDHAEHGQTGQGDQPHRHRHPSTPPRGVVGQRVQQPRQVGVAVGWRRTQRPEQCPVHPAGHRRDVDLAHDPVGDEDEEVRVVLVGEGQLPVQSLEQRHCERELVGGGTHGQPEQLLGRHERGRAHRATGLRELLVGDAGQVLDPRIRRRERLAHRVGVDVVPAPRGLGETEVEHPNPPVGTDDDVSRLEVTVGDAGPVRRRQAVTGLDEARDDLAPIVVGLVEPVVEGHPVDVLHRDVQPSREHVDVVDRHDVGVVEPRQRLRLAKHAGATGEAALPLVVQDLQRNLAVELGIVGGVDGAHPADADDVEHDVTADTCETVAGRRGKGATVPGIRDERDVDGWAIQEIVGTSLAARALDGGRQPRAVSRRHRRFPAPRVARTRATTIESCRSGPRGAD